MKQSLVILKRHWKLIQYLEDTVKKLHKNLRFFMRVIILRPVLPRPFPKFVPETPPVLLNENSEPFNGPIVWINNKLS